MLTPAAMPSAIRAPAFLPSLGVFGPLAAGWLYDRELAGPFWLAAALSLVVAWTARGLPARIAAGGGADTGRAGAGSQA